MQNSSTDSKLDSLPGLASAKRVVRRLSTEELGVHAVLIYGTVGSGKDELAEILTEAWLCSSPGSSGACGECQSCRTFERKTNADLLHIKPVGASSIIRQAAVVQDDTQDDYPVSLRQFFRTSPIYSRHKVGLIQQAHRMNSASSNALLKTLEEPHPYVKLVLTTDSISTILPTILSRCLAISCELPTEDELMRLFPAATKEDILLAEGAPVRLQNILRKPGPYRDIQEFARSLPHRKPSEALVLSDKFKDLADKLDGAGARVNNSDALAMLATCLARNPDANPRWAQWTLAAHRHVVGNGAAQAVFDSLFARMLTS